MRPCKSRSKNQVFEYTAREELKFVLYFNPFCLMSNPNGQYMTGTMSMGIFDCDTSVSLPDKFKWTPPDHEGYWRQTKNNNNFVVGFDINRQFSRLRLYKEGSLNPSTSLWSRRFGYQHGYDNPAVGNFMYLSPPNTVAGAPLKYLSVVGDLSNVDNLTATTLTKNGLDSTDGIGKVENAEWVIRRQLDATSLLFDTRDIPNDFLDQMKYGDVIYLQHNFFNNRYLNQNGQLSLGETSAGNEIKWEVIKPNDQSSTDDIFNANEIVLKNMENDKFLNLSVGGEVVLSSEILSNATPWTVKIDNL